MGRRSGLLDLPEEVLAVILGLLCHLPSLMAVRLVCHLLRKVSYFVITDLNMGDKMSEALCRTPGSAQWLRALPCLTKLCLYGNVLQRPDLLALPRVPSLLRELHVGAWRCRSETAQAFCEAVKSATGITSLSWRTIGGEALVPSLLSSCPQLLLLEVQTGQSLPAAFCNAVLRLSDLETLRISWPERQVWDDLPPSLNELPCLRSLADVPVAEPATAAVLAGLTRLTQLQVYLRRSRSRPQLTALSRLSALQSLKVHSSWGEGESMVPLGFDELPPGMSQLTELAVCGPFSAAGFRKLVRVLPRLARLQLRGSAGRMPFLSEASSQGLGHLLTEGRLQGLRHLSLSPQEGKRRELGALCVTLTGLESLALNVTRVSETDVFQDLARLTRLTSLQISATMAWQRHVPAFFLKGLTGLVELALVGVLSEHNAEADIKCLARLTRLQRLVVGSRDGNGCGYLVSHQVPTGPEAPVLERRHFEPLRALRWLEVWDLYGAWRTPPGRENEPDEVVRELCCCPGYSPKQCSLVSSRFVARPLARGVSEQYHPFD